MKKKNFISFVILFVLILFLVTYILERIIESKGKSFLKEKISKETESQVNIANIRLNILKSTLEIEGITFNENSDYKGMNTVQRILLYYNPWMLFKRKVFIEKITIQEPQLTLSQNNQNKSEFCDLIKTIQSIVARNKKWLQKISVENIEVFKCTLIYFTQKKKLHPLTSEMDIYATLTWKKDTDITSIDIINLSLSTIASKISLSGTIYDIYGDLHIDLQMQSLLSPREFQEITPSHIKFTKNIEISNHIQASATELKIKNGTLFTGDFKVGRTHIEKCNALFSYEPNKFKFDTIQMDLEKGKITGWLNIYPKEESFETTLEAESINLTEEFRSIPSLPSSNFPPVDIIFSMSGKGLSLKRFDGKGTILLTTSTEPHIHLESTYTLNKGFLRIEDTIVKSESDEFIFNAIVDTTSGKFNATYAVHLHTIGQYIGSPEYKLKGSFASQGKIAGNMRETRGLMVNGDIESKNIQINNLILNRVAGNFTYSNNLLTVHALNLDKRKTILRGILSFQFPENGPPHLSKTTFEFKMLEARDILAFFKKDLPMEGTIQGKGEFQERLGNFAGEIEMQSPNINVYGRSIGRIDTSLEYGNDTVSSKNLTITKNSHTFSGRVTYNLKLEKGTFTLESKKLNLADIDYLKEKEIPLAGHGIIKLAGHLDRNTLNAQGIFEALNVRYRDATTSTKVKFEMFSTGGLKNLKFEGVATIEDGNFRSNDLLREAREIKGTIKLKDNKTSVFITGNANNGKFTIKGTTCLDGYTITGLDLQGILEHANVGASGVYEITGDSNIRVVGDLQELMLSGAIMIKEGAYTKDLFIEPMMNGKKEDSYSQFSNTIAKNILINLRISTPHGGLWVRNNVAEVETQADITIKGSAKKPKISGKIEVLHGFVLLVGRKFTITEAVVNFTDSE
ncbi:MAG: translocation/assembly module TamB domain-containing protein, partial [Thermodesulfobacteriota bacterium]|nr:translocation/assembly module TamB domain-containing protein [Thermodesulfobacteriota bacterium]